MFSKLKNHQTFMKYFYNTSWLFIEKIFRMVLGAFIGIWLARYLGPEQFGLLNYAQSFVGFFIAVASLGLDSIIVRELVKNEDKQATLLMTSMWLKFISSLIMLVILSIAFNFTSNDSFTNLFSFIIASSAIFQCFNVIEAYFQSKVMGKYIVLANMFSQLFSSLVKIICILTNASLIIFAWIIILENIMLAIGYIYFYTKQISNAPIKIFSFDKSLALSLIKDSWFLMIISLSAMIYERIDQIMIKEMLGASSVGLYSVAVRIYGILIAFSPIFAYSFQTALISAHQISVEQFEKRLILLYSFTIWTILPASIIISAYSQDIISITFGEKYSGAEEVLKIYIYCATFAFIGGISSRWFIIYNIQKFMSIYLIISAILNVVLNIFLIPLYGIYGAGLASVIAFSFSATFSNLLNTKTYRNFKLQYLAVIYPFTFLYKKLIRR